MKSRIFSFKFGWKHFRDPNDQSLLSMTLIAPVGDSPITDSLDQRKNNSMTIQKADAPQTVVDIMSVDDYQSACLIQGRLLTAERQKIGIAPPLLHDQEVDDGEIFGRP